MKALRRSVPLALAGALALAAPVLAGTVTTASGPSPLASCSLGATPGAMVTTNAEVEPFVAANPTTANTASPNLIGVWQQDPWSTGAARGSVAAATFDGGRTWAEVPLPFTGCTAGAIADPATGQPFDRAADSWVSFGPEGIAYTSALAASTSTLDNGIVAARSVDGGRTWGSAAVVHADLSSPSGPTHFFNDKDAVTADPTRPGTAYLVWDRLQAPQGFPLLNHAQAFTGPTLLSVTTDGGRTWGPARVIVDLGQNNQTLGNQVVVAPDGTLYDFFDAILTTGANSTGANTPAQHGQNVAFVKSIDAGLTWSAPTIVSPQDDVGVSDPNTGAPVTSGGDSNVSPAVDRSSGTLYVGWQDARFSGGSYDEIALSSSSDGGRHWSTPARVNTPTGKPAFTPAIAVTADGTVGVTYYDVRTLTAGNTSTLPTNNWLRKSGPGGAAFGPDVALVPADQPFNLLAAPSVRGGSFLGDYQGLTTVGTAFSALFVTTNCSDASCGAGPDPTDVFYRAS